MSTYTPSNYHKTILDPHFSSGGNQNTSGNYHRVNINPMQNTFSESDPSKLGGAPTMQESWKRLEDAEWSKNKKLTKVLKSNDNSAEYQPLTSGYGKNHYDEYSIIIGSFPASLTPMEYLVEFAMDPNSTVKNKQFDAMNAFRKRNSDNLTLGDIWDIDILGPDNGSIALVDKSINFGVKNSQYGWFDIQTLTCDENGEHPESGAREFGFLTMPYGQGIKFYTRGVSRPVDFSIGNPVAASFGSTAQGLSWKGMMRGILNSVVVRGGCAKNQEPTVFVK